MNEKIIDNIAINAINEFKHLHLGHKDVITPYFINDKYHKDLRAMVGKGTPEEIIMEAKIWEKLKGVSFENMSSDKIKQFLTDKKIGIDCSGFIIHVLDKLYKKITNKHIWSLLKVPNKSFMGKLRYFLRPVENLGAEIITNEENTIKIDIINVLPTDLIRSKAKKINAHHIMIITKVEYDKNNVPCIIEYTHSSPNYGDLNGIKEGVIKINNVNEPLQAQEWLEKDAFGVNHTYEGFLIEAQDNGIRRIKGLNFQSTSVLLN